MRGRGEREEGKSTMGKRHREKIYARNGGVMANWKMWGMEFVPLYPGEKKGHGFFFFLRFQASLSRQLCTGKSSPRNFLPPLHNMIWHSSNGMLSSGGWWGKTIFKVGLKAPPSIHLCWERKRTNPGSSDRGHWGWAGHDSAIRLAGWKLQIWKCRARILLLSCGHTCWYSAGHSCSLGASYELGNASRLGVKPEEGRIRGGEGSWQGTSSILQSGCFL